VTRKFFLKIGIGCFLAVCIALAAAMAVLPRLLDLDAYRAQILSTVQAALNRHVSYETASFSWRLTPVVVFRGITIAEKAGAATFLAMDRLTFKLALLPLLHKEVRLREIVVERPLLTVHRNQAGVFNFTDLLTGPSSDFTFSFSSVRVNNARVTFTDHLLDPQGFSTSLENLSLSVNGLTRGEKTAFKLSTMIPGGSESSTVTISGTALLPAAEKPLSDALVNVTLTAKNVDPGRYWPYFGHLLPGERLRGRMDLEQVFTGTPAEFVTNGRLSIKGLWFKYPKAFPAPLTPRAVRLSYAIKRTPRDLALQSFDLDLDGFKAKGSCALGDTPSHDPRITARVAIAPFRLEGFSRYIPYGIIPTGTANFIQHHIKGGVFQIDEARLDGRVSQIAHMEQGENSTVLLVRGRVDKGVMDFGPEVPLISNIKGNLEMRGKDFTLSRMAGTFGGSPFTLDGKIADYPLDTPSSYPFTMTIVPQAAEIAWLLRQEGPSVLDFSGQSLLHVAGAGTGADYRITGAWDLSAADYRYQQLVHKPAGMVNQLSFSTHLGEEEFRLEDLRYILPTLDVTANAIYRYSAPVPLSFAVNTNRFMVNPDIPLMPALANYHPSGSLQATISGSANPVDPSSIKVQGDITLTDFAVQPSAQIQPLSAIAGTVHVTESTLATEQLTGKVGNSAFAVKGRLTGFASPVVDLDFSSPHLQLEDVGFHSSGPLPEMKALAGSISLKDRHLAISSLSGQMDQTHFTLSGEVLDLGTPRINLRVHFPQLRLEELLPMAGLQRAGGEGQSREITLRASVTATAGSGRDIPFKQLETELTLEKNRLVIPMFRVGMFNGTIAGSGKADFAANGGPTYEASYGLDHVDAAQFLKAAGAKPYISGLLQATGVLTARGSTPAELKAAVQGSAEILLTDGVLKIPVTDEQPGANEAPFKTLQTRLSYAGKVLDVHSAAMEVFGGKVAGSGRADFSAPDAPAYRLSCQMVNVDATAFLKAVDATKDISGFMNLQADLSFSGNQETALQRSLRGSLTLHLEKGIIYRYGLISKVFSLLNVSQLLDFRLPDLMTTGTPYDRIDGTYAFKDGKVSTRDLSIHSPAVGMTIVGDADLLTRELDAKIGVQPFQTVGRVVNRIPIIGWLLTGGKKRVLVVYYEAKGKWNDPTVTALPMGSITDGVHDVFKRAFNLPEKLITEPGNVLLGN